MVELSNALTLSNFSKKHVYHYVYDLEKLMLVQNERSTSELGFREPMYTSIVAEAAELGSLDGDPHVFDAVLIEGTSMKDNTPMSLVHFYFMLKHFPFHLNPAGTCTPDWIIS